MKISLFYQHVTVLDYAYFDYHLGFVGDSLVVDVEFIGHTDDEGVVFDFSHAKKKVKEIIDRECDHRLVIPEKLLKKSQKKALLDFSYGAGKKSKVSYTAPLEAFCEIPSHAVSNASLAAHLENIVMKEMPKNVAAIKISLNKEVLGEKDLFFHYIHGLKYHYGNCQRLIHGHRSTLQIFKDGQRSYADEANLVQNSFRGNIHFVFWENVQNKKELKKYLNSKTGYGVLSASCVVHLKYKSSQGEFEAHLPSEMVYILPIETTVENLSLHFAEVMKNLYPKSHICVVAYEGIGKGAKSTL
jgi:6-pyruvoyl-tetrahydropterin synthase